MNVLGLLPFFFLLAFLGIARLRIDPLGSGC